MSRIHPRRKVNRHSIDITDPESITLFASIRPATPLFHRTLRRSVQDSRTYQAIIPLSMGRIHYLANHSPELKSMQTVSVTPLRARRSSQHTTLDSPYRPPSRYRKRLVAKSPFPMKYDQKSGSPPDTPIRRTPTPGLRNFKLPKGVVEEYEGEYLNGLCHGDGKALYSNGDTYQGQWFDGKKQGIGTKFYNYFQAEYHGDWFNDEKNGFGIMKFSNGDEIEGFWEGGNVNGENTIITFASGCSYQGSVYRGLRHGSGKMMYFEGVEYSGNWKEDLREGLGSLTYKDSWFFEGFFRNDSTDGPGILLHRTTDSTGSTQIRLNNKKIFHPLIPYLPVLQDFQKFVKIPHYTTDIYVFSIQSPTSGSFRGGKLSG